jgi:hypothetical protein
MRLSILSLCSAGLLLGGCVVQQPQPAIPFSFGAYSAPGYSFAGYDDPGGQLFVGPDGLTYVNGEPVTMLDGEPLPIFYDPGLGGWGYFDQGHHFHHTPPEMRDRLNRFHPEGRGLPPLGSFHSGPGGLSPAAIHGGPASPSPGGPPGAFRSGQAEPFPSGLHGGAGPPGVANAPPEGGSHAASVL